MLYRGGLCNVCLIVGSQATRGYWSRFRCSNENGELPPSNWFLPVSLFYSCHPFPCRALLVLSISFYIFFVVLVVSMVAWENTRHFAPPLVSSRNVGCFPRLDWRGLLTVYMCFQWKIGEKELIEKTLFFSKASSCVLLFWLPTIILL